MKPYLSGEGSPNRGGLSLPKNKRILGAALLLVLGLIFVFFAVSPWEILPFLKGGSFRVQAGIIGGFVLAWRLLVAAWYVPLTLYRLLTAGCACIITED